MSGQARRACDARVGGGGGTGGRAGGRAEGRTRSWEARERKGAAEAGECGEGKGAEEGRRGRGQGRLGGEGDLALGQRPGLR